MAALAMRRNSPALLMSFHRTRGLETARFRDRVRNALVGLRVGAVVTASKERLRHYIDNNYFDPAKVSCIPLGIDLERFRPDPVLRARTRRHIGAGEGTLVVDGQPMSIRNAVAPTSMYAAAASHVSCLGFGKHW